MAVIVSFDAERASRYIEHVFRGYLQDPADSDFQRGYLAALLTLYRKGLGNGEGHDRLRLRERQVEQ